MAKSQAPKLIPKLIRAFVWGNADQDRMVELTGLKRMHVYRGDIPSKWSMRPGEYLGIFDLRAFGPERADWIAGLRHATKNGATVVEVNDDGTFGAMCDNASGAVLLADTLRRIKAEQVMPKEKAKRMAAARHAAQAAKRKPADEVEAIWRNVRRFKFVEDALARMPGWSRERAYREFGPRGVPRGRKPTKD